LKEGVSVPKPATLARYGLVENEWQAILERQGGVCAVCKKLPPSGRLVTDHEHVKGWKKLPPEKRKMYVRGVLCWTCNHYYVGRGITADKARNVVTYLESYARRWAAEWLPR